MPMPDSIASSPTADRQRDEIRDAVAALLRTRSRLRDFEDVIVRLCFEALAKHRAWAADPDPRWRGTREERTREQREIGELRAAAQGFLRRLRVSGERLDSWVPLAEPIDAVERSIGALIVRLGELAQKLERQRAPTRDVDPVDLAVGVWLRDELREATGSGTGHRSVFPELLQLVLRVAKGDPAFDGAALARRVQHDRSIGFGRAKERSVQG